MSDLLLVFGREKNFIMPSLTGLLKSNKNGSSNSRKNKRDPGSVNGNIEKSPSRLGLFRRAKPTSGLRKSGSTSRILETSGNSLSTLSSHQSTIPKCNTVANFAPAGYQAPATTAALGPHKCNSLVTFVGSPPASLRPSFSLSRCPSQVSISSVGISHRQHSRSQLSTCCSIVPVYCKLCLSDVSIDDTVDLASCSCLFCKDCLQQYLTFEIRDGSTAIKCPDALCTQQGVILQDEIQHLVDSELFDKYRGYVLNKEVALDPTRAWCPRAGCDTICAIPTSETVLRPMPVHCPTCGYIFCSQCKFRWHGLQSCESYAKRLAKHSAFEEGLVLREDENACIKRCPLCRVPIERDDGCAQMMCKCCKHVFCWYCLTSLDDDFLLRHYDKGPCKNKLGHSRVSVFWHRTQVIGIFAGFGLLLLVASPLLLLAAPCILCCRCKGCAACPDDDVSDSKGAQV